MKSANFIQACESAWHAQDFSTCKPLGLDAATWTAILTAAVGVMVFVGRRVLSRRHASRAGGYYVTGTLLRSRFRNICRLIKPLMDENYRIFSQFGPNGGGSADPDKNVRFELGIWYQMRSQIIENNSRIRSIIIANISGVPHQYILIFRHWLDHIDAFYAHVLDDAADYRDHQFPKEVSEIVTRNA